MQRRFYLLAGIVTLLVLGALFATQGAPSTQPAAGAQADSAPDPDTATYWATVHQAQAALEAGEFEKAIDLARQAAATNPDDNTAWTVLRAAAVASAADQYLRNLPESRYRIKPVNYLADLVNGKQYFVIDVREPDEFAAGHIEGAVNIPLRTLTRQLNRLPDSKTMPILVYCHSQKRATHALVILRELGYTQVYNLEGGIVAYQEWVATHAMPTPGPTATPEPEAPSC
ncbi:MAG: rhodanese-like domain-containing protein [Chloroflexi bacterium]|nr:MAG: rhodanese-like domain-containing protein [Chloroflexota bacterium]